MKIEPFIEPYQELSQRFIKLLETLSALKSLSSIDIKAASEREICERALRALLEYEDFQRCSVYLWEEKRLVNIAGRDWGDLFGDPKKLHPASFALGEGMVGLAAKTRTLQHCKDCSRDPRFKVLPGREVKGSLISVPILLEDELLGVLNVYHPEPHAYGDEHERLLGLYSAFLAQLLSLHRYAKRMVALVEGRTQALARTLAQAQRLKQRYQALAFVDDLTRLANRRFFFPEAQAALARALRAKTPFAVMIIDLDHFKRINDTYGHSVGDRVLRRVAEALREEIREADILARFGGEEFACALPDTGEKGAKALAKRLLERIRGLRFKAKGKAFGITASIGIAVLPPGHGLRIVTRSLLERLLAEADEALYWCKRHGRDRFRHTVFKAMPGPPGDG